MCRPVFVEASDYPVLHISNGRHPCILHTYSGENFVPNDVVIDGKRTCLLVTGPNMGGKSTLMRQTGLIVVLAHLVRLGVGHGVHWMAVVFATGLLCSRYRVQVESSGQGVHSNGSL